MSRVAVVSTSINPRPVAYERWAQAGQLIVAGDRNSPAGLQEYVKELGGVYLTEDEQEVFHFSDWIGWKCVQRRNTAIMTAYAAGFDYVITVDDDNLPLPSGKAWLAGHAESMSHAPILSTVGSRSGFLNTGLFCQPRFHQRGVPYGINTEAVVRRAESDSSIEVVVSQAQVVGDPDCDAVERLVHRPEVFAVTTNVVVAPGTYAAFNSQATMWKHDWIPVMACLPHIGRYDDIFASFIFARLARTFNVALHVGTPVASSHERNEHDAVRDLAAELWGMNHVLDFCRALDEAYISTSMPLWMAYSELMFSCRDILPAKTIAFANEWVKAWKEIAEK